MASVFKQSYTKSLPDGTRVTRQTRKWYAEYVDADGMRRRVPGYKDRAATEQLAARLERESARKAEGLTDPAREHRARPLSEHLAHYAGHLEAKGDTAGHVRDTTGRVRAFLEGCGFARLDDLDVGKAAAWLKTLRKAGDPVAVPTGVESFTPAQTAALLNVSGPPSAPR
jgi:hypothetical protein